MTKDWVQVVGHSRVCQILLRITVGTVLTSFPPVWTSSAGMMLMTSDDVNSVTGKKLVIFEGWVGGGGGIELIRRGEPVDPKQMLALIRNFNLSDLNVSVAF